ncbi:MAG: hypothetical protein BWY02_02517 [bacterium ADurb.Bin157]|nr:MAG: hypothetical protein BWY02_02517 [bacterium ADurb.Bin157]
MSKQFYDIANRIDELTEKYSIDNLNEIQNLFTQKGIEYYFFAKKLMEIEDPLVWFLPLKEKGYFNGNKNISPKEVQDQPGFFTIPFWNVLPYLERVAKLNKQNPSDEITKGLMEVVDSIICYRQTDGKRIENYRTDWFITKIIFMLPCNKWNGKNIDFINIAIKSSFGSALIQSEINKSVLPALIEHKSINLILKLLEIILDFAKTEGGTSRKTKPIMERYWQRDALSKFKKQIAELCGLEAAKIGINTIKRLLAENEGEFSYIWITTIEDSKQNQFPDKYESQLVFFIRDMLESLKPEESKDIVKELLAEKHYIFKRIAIHIINRQYNELNNLFWEWKDNPLNEYGCRHELFGLLKKNCSLFTKEQINTVLNWIETKEYNDTDAQALAFRKKGWLSTLNSANDPKVNAKYKEYDKIASGEVEHADAFIWHKDGKMRDRSPIPPAELLEKTNEEIADYLNISLPERGWHDPSQEGLNECLRQCIKQNSAKFTSNLKPFLKIPRIYQNSIIRCLSEIKQTDGIQWTQVFYFIEAMILEDIFWNETYDKEHYNYRDWIIASIADLIENGCNYEKNIFGRSLLTQIEKVLLILIEKTKAKEPEMERLIDHVLNSPKGKVLSAIIHYCLCYARLKKDEKIRWPDAIMKDFTKRLDRAIESSTDYSVTLGLYLENMLYLDKQWVIDNIERIFPKKDFKHWSAAFVGYLSYSQHVYETPYKILRENGHYAKAINTDFSDDYVQEKLVQHICVGFLENWEKLDDSTSLICLLLNKGKPKHLSEIVQFIGTVEGEEPEKKIKDKIKPLWKKMYEFLEKKKDDKEYQSVISEFCRWLDIIDDIDDEVLPWIKLTAKYINVNYLDSMLVQNLAKHVEKNPKNVGEIYIEMLNGGAYPDYDQEDIVKIVKSLYHSGYKTHADTICNMYGEVGSDFLRPLYLENHAGE